MSDSLWPGLFAFLAVTIAAMVIIDFGIFVFNRYCEKYIQETGTELDDVLIQIPANKILDISLAISALGGILSVIVIMWFSDDFSWKGGLFFGFLAAGVLFPAPRLILRYLRKQRLYKFNIQLEDALGMISSSLKAGFSINQALEEIAGQNIHPISVEFKLLTQEIRLGVPLEQALENMNYRVESDDFELVTTAILTARQTGGELTGTLERVAALIRERVRISNKLRATTAMGRLQAIMVGSMPFLLFAGLLFVAPQVMAGFTSGPIGIIALIVVVVLDVIGYLVIKKITTIEV